MNALTGCLVFFLILALLVYAWPLLLLLAVIAIIYQIYASIYFKGESFSAIKGKIQNHIQDCNDLNDHIEELKSTALVVNRTDYGEAVYHDNSRWNVKRDALKNQTYAPYIYECSRTVCDNARKEPFKYICKYFGIKADEETLEKFETALNDFSAAEDGKVALKAEREAILESISADIPWAIKKFSQKKLEKNLGFEEVDFSTLYFPKYEFKYTSAGGNTGTTYDVVMDIDNLNRFVVYLSEKIKFSKSVAGQRALMTSKLRQHIKERDHFTCKCCGASIEAEPHLLLEIDHIIPVSKGGLTTEDNLQTLCWRWISLPIQGRSAFLSFFSLCLNSLVCLFRYLQSNGSGEKYSIQIEKYTFLLKHTGHEKDHLRTFSVGRCFFIGTEYSSQDQPAL